MRGQNFLILAINPGSTSTKIGIFENEKAILEKTIRHPKEEIEAYDSIYDQYPFREKLILQTLEEENVNINEFDAIVGRGGLLKPVISGPYKVNEEVIHDAKIGYQGQHASNLGAVLAHAIAKNIGPDVPSLFLDPPAVDEFEPLAYVSGLKGIRRRSLFHALNIKATIRKTAKDMGKNINELNFVAVHLGGGISVCAVKQGKVIDVNNAISEGAFTPERTGHLPMLDFTEFIFEKLRCEADVIPFDTEKIKNFFSKKEKEIKKKLVGKGGLVSYLNTNSAQDVQNRIKNGDEDAELIYHAMAYQIAKYIGEMATVLMGNIDAIVITGGIAHDKHFLIPWIEERVNWMAPVKVYPGEDELEALALGALRVLKGEEESRTYPEKYDNQ